MARKVVQQIHTTLTMSSTTVGFSSKRNIEIEIKVMTRVTKILDRTNSCPPIPPLGKGSRSDALGLKSILANHGGNAMNNTQLVQICRVLCRQSEIIGLVVFQDTDEFHKLSLQISISWGQCCV